MPSVNCASIKNSPKTVYAKNGSTKTILDHLKHGIGKNSALINDPSQKSCSEVFQEEEESAISVQ